MSGMERREPRAGGVGLASACGLLALLLFLVGLVGPVRRWLLPGDTLVRFLAVAVGFLALVVGSVALDLARTRARLLPALEEVLQALWGESFRQDRQAVDILVRALESEDPTARAAALRNLERLTGQAFGEDTEAWRRWWEANRSSFRRADSSPERSGRGDER